MSKYPLPIYVPLVFIHKHTIFHEEFKRLQNATPRYFTPEQKYHQYRHLVRSREIDAIQQVLDRIYRIEDEEGPFNGIFGNSEDATIAATFLTIDYLQKVAKEERTAGLKCAVFMSGGAPFTADGKVVLLADEHGQAITIPTCHIIGRNDSVAEGAVALYRLCNEESATVVDPRKGHMVPHDESSSRIMIKGIRDLTACCSGEDSLREGF